VIRLFHDPVADTIAACNQLFPDLGNIQIVFEIAPTRGINKRWGWTEFDDDGNLLCVGVNVRCPYQFVPEIVAHEIAHVVAHKEAPATEDDHGPTWERYFSLIFDTYNENLGGEKVAHK
jgi:hypothetical protein